MPTFASMDEKGAPDMNPEQWANAVYEPLNKSVAEGRLVIGNKAPITGLGEGWWITPGTVEKHSGNKRNDSSGNFRTSRVVSI